MMELEAIAGDAGKMIAFLQEIGLSVRLTTLEQKTFVPGVLLEPDGLAIDLERLHYPGDLLHEAGHLAVMLPAQRMTTGMSAGDDMGDEIAAQCWSYAAAVHLEIDPAVVFHPHGYHDSAETLISTYRDGNAGVVLLQWMGMTTEAKHTAETSQPIWPHMRRWLREDPEASP